MPPVPPSQQWPRGPWNELHKAAVNGCAERTDTVLSSGAIDINEGDPHGWTPLMYAAYEGHSHVAKILLNKGANVSIVADSDLTALLISAKRGFLGVTKMLIKAGASVAVTTPKYGVEGYTPLHFSATEGHSEVMRSLIEAGANPNSRASNGATPLYLAAGFGDVDVIKMLLRSEADPLLTATSLNTTTYKTFVPLDEAAAKGHSEAVRELLQPLGIEGCGGASGGTDALTLAARHQRVDVMAILMDAGVVDTGEALIIAAGYGREVSVKVLLEQQGCKARGEEAYADAFARFQVGPMLNAVGLQGYPAPRIVRMLVDAGANTTSSLRLRGYAGSVIFDGTPLTYANFLLHEKKVRGKEATEKQLNSLEAIRRLLLQVEAVHAASWLWPSDVSSIGHAVEGTSRTKVKSAQLISMLPILRRRAGRHRVLLAALNRYSRKT